MKRAKQSHERSRLSKKLGIKRVSAKRGLAPGTVVHVGERKVESPSVRVIDFDAGQVTERELAQIEECKPIKDKPTVTWINVDGLHDTELIERCGKLFNIHALVLEDIVNTGQRPKAEDFGDYLYVTCKMLSWDDEHHEARSEQLSIILGPTWVLTFQERRGDVFEAVRERIRHGRGRVRGMDPGYLCFALLDALVDNYFGVLEHVGDQLEPLEERVLTETGVESVQALHKWKREMLSLKKAIWPLRETFAGLERGESQLFSKETRLFLRDLHDHAIQVIDTIESIRDMLGGLLDLHLTIVSNRMNEVMKVLTIIATIFIPLTFIAGIYGMNFEYMPELKWPWGYFGVWGIMAAVTITMVVFFRRKRWL